VSDRIPDPPPRPAEAFPHWRTVDAVRACALGNAATVAAEQYQVAPDDLAGWVIDTAKQFEAYLTEGGDGHA
jgi:hypothetical protein